MRVSEVMESVADIPGDYELIIEVTASPVESYVFRNAEITRIDGLEQCVLRVSAALSANILG